MALTLAERGKIDVLVRRTMAQQHLAGLSLAIAQGGVILYARGYGYRDVGRRLPVEANTIYNIASMSKQFTAACVLLLQQDGKLSLDDPLSKYLPQLRHTQGVTLARMLNHTSGMPDYLDLIDNNHLSYPKIMAALENAPLKFAPGTRFEYSNTNYALMGPVVRQASGMPFDEFVTRRIIEPLHLGSTSVGTTPIDLPNGAAGYTVVKGKTVPAVPQDAAQLDFPDGGVNSTVVDLVAWDTALDSGQVLGAGFTRRMMTPGPYERYPGVRYGFGLDIASLDGHREIYHQGEWTGYAGENATFPDNRFDVILLSNTDGFDEEPLVRQIYKALNPT